MKTQKSPAERKAPIRLKRVTGLEKRWLLNNVSVMIVLVLLCVVLIALTISAYS